MDRMPLRALPSLSMPPTTDRIRAIHAAVILFLAVLLMFWAEPLAARMVLPFLGGAPMI